MRWFLAVVVIVALAGCGPTTTSRSAPALSVPAGYQVAANQVFFATPNNGWLTVSLTPLTSKKPWRGAVLATRDGGASWQVEWQSTGYPAQLASAGPDGAMVTLWPSPGCSPGNGQCPSRLLAFGTGLPRVVGHTKALAWSSAWSSPTRGIEALAGPACDNSVDTGAKPSPPVCSFRLALTTNGGRRFVTVLSLKDDVVGVGTDGGRRWWAVVNVVKLKKQYYTSQLQVWTSTDSGQHWRQESVIARPLQAVPVISAMTTAAVVTHGDQLWLSVVDPESCAMHGCGTALVLESKDTGRSWSDVPSPLGPPMGCGPGRAQPLSVAPDGLAYVANEANLAACAPPGSVLREWDGTTWRTVQTWLCAGLTSLSWPSSTTGYAVVNGALVRTNDAGHHWGQVWPALAPTGPLAALSARNAVAAGDFSDPGVVLGTSDAGRHWSVLAHLEGDITQLAFADRDDGEAAVLDTSDNIWALDTTTDGGRHWARVAALPHPVVGQPYRFGTTGLWMASRRRSLLLTTTGADVYGPGVAPAQLWATSDGGRRWAKVGALPANEYRLVGSAAFEYRDGRWQGIAAAYPRLDMTRDGGRTWQSLPHGPAFTGASSVGPHLIVALSDVNVSFRFSISTDGGHHWRASTLPGRVVVPDIGEESNLAFTNAADGWWETGGSVFSTHDGGLRWSLEVGP